MSENEEQEEQPRQRRRSDDSGENEVAQRMEKELEQGYVGTVPDPTPNENYTASGVNEGLPTPETDDDLANEARNAVFRPTRRSQE